ncbi:MAG TPA: NAD kinase [Paludibacteraceae bacterium]|nr:NAD kinase [Paludibacteraceae bacterium]HPT43655.1 NAD kinase [Paludibacteraceae bacterium]
MPEKECYRIAIFGNLHRTELGLQVSQIFSFFQDKNIVVLLDEYMQNYIHDTLHISFNNEELISGDNFTADLALSIGGDGTFLNTAARIGNKNIPILGINTGRLGFLADIAKNEVIEALQGIFDNKYTIEKRSLMKVETLDGTRLDAPYALNDVALSKQDSSSMIIVHAKTKGELINSYQADGLIISTPTGSTAYSMSVGGPIVVPQARSFVISPVASHSLNVRPLIVPDDWVIELEVVSRSNSYQISLDGRSKVMDQSTRLRIRKADYEIKVLKPLNHTFFETLRNKLLWGVDKRND